MTVRRRIKTAAFCFALLSVVACAHKSGHRRESLAQHSNREVEKMEKEDVSQHEVAPVEVPQVSNVTSRTKMDGSAIFSRYNTAVFMVFTSDGSNAYQGSGFFINSNGLAVSNYHVFQGTHIGAEQIKLANSDRVYKVTQVIARDEDEDFILFKVDISQTNFIPIAGSKPQVGEKVFAIGSPRGLENTFSSGEVSQWRDRNLMQISALIDHGSSGGALINEYGEVVGITSGSFVDGSQANLNYAWSIDVIKPYIGR